MEHLIRRMKHFVELGDADFAPLRDLQSHARSYDAGQVLVSFDEVVDEIFVVEEGWALRTRFLPDGRRQVINLMLAGDYFDLMSLVGAKSDHSVRAATDIRLRIFKGEDFMRAIRSSARLTAAFWWVTVREEASLRHQIVRIGRMNAQERIANFIMEISHRQDIASGTRSEYVALPLPQSVLADALGLSIVHVSRSLTALKSRGLLQADRRGVTILDHAAMVELAGFATSHPAPGRLPLAAQ